MEKSIPRFINRNYPGIAPPSFLGQYFWEKHNQELWNWSGERRRLEEGILSDFLILGCPSAVGSRPACSTAAETLSVYLADITGYIVEHCNINYKLRQALVNPGNWNMYILYLGYASLPVSWGHLSLSNSLIISSSTRTSSPLMSTIVLVLGPWERIQTKLRSTSMSLKGK